MKSVSDLKPAFSIPTPICKRAATFALVLIGAVVLAVRPAVAVPVLPGADGYGINTAAGRGGTVYRVTNLNDSGTGSLRAALQASGTRIVIFEVSGTISLDSNITISSGKGNLTVAGQTAPSPGITIKGAAIRITDASDILIQHLRFRTGDLPQGPEYSNRDCFQILGQNGATNIVVDHCSFAWGVDETVNVWYAGATDITFRNCIFGESLTNENSSQGPGKGVIIGPGPDSTGAAGKRVLLDRSVFTHLKSRAPRIQNDGVVVANNVLYNWETGTTNIGEGSSNARHSIVGNYYKPGPDSSPNVKPVVIRSNLQNGAQVYVHDNIWEGNVITDDWDIVTDQTSFDPRPSSAPTWPFWVEPASVDLFDEVLANAGARPLDRDLVDRRIIDNTRDGDGTTIGSQTETVVIGETDPDGWPILAENTRALTIPPNPNQDDDADGYTNIEEWLHAFARAVEPRAASWVETFESGQAQNWSADGGTWSVAAEVTSVYRQTNNVAPANRTVLGSTALWTDQAVEADVKVISYGDGASGGFVGLVGRYQDPQNYYYLMLNSNNNEWKLELKKMVNGTHSPIRSAVPYAFSSGTWYTLKLEIIGDSLKGYVNGAFVIEGSDSDLSSGKAGLITYRAAASFDDFIAYQNAADVMAFGDDFEDGNADGWATTSGAWSVVTDGTNVYRQTNAAVTARSTINGKTWVNQIYEADLKASSFGNGGWMGLMVRYKDINNYYYITMFPSGVLELKRMVNGSFSLIKSTSINTNAIYPVRIKALDDTLKVYISGVLELETKDSSLSEGGTAGLKLYRAVVDYDDILVTAP